MRVTLQFFIEPDDGGFHAFSPALKGLHADGASPSEAARNFVEGAAAYLASVLTHNEPLPVGIVADLPHDAESYTEEIIVPWVPPSLLTSGDNSRA